MTRTFGAPPKDLYHKACGITEKVFTVVNDEQHLLLAVGHRRTESEEDHGHDHRPPARDPAPAAFATGWRDARAHPWQGQQQTAVRPTRE
jgi:hypothetical protein